MAPTSPVEDRERPRRGPDACVGLPGFGGRRAGGRRRQGSPKRIQPVAPLGVTTRTQGSARSWTSISSPATSVVSTTPTSLGWSRSSVWSTVTDEAHRARVERLRERLREAGRQLVLEERLRLGSGSGWSSGALEERLRLRLEERLVLEQRLFLEHRRSPEVRCAGDQRGPLGFGNGAEPGRERVVVVESDVRPAGGRRGNLGLHRDRNCSVRPGAPPARDDPEGPQTHERGEERGEAQHLRRGADAARGPGTAAIRPGNRRHRWRRARDARAQGSPKRASTASGLPNPTGADPSFEASPRARARWSASA